MKKLLQAGLAIGTILFSLAGVCAETTDMPVSNLQVIVNESGLPVITGMVANQTGKRVKNAFIHFNLYDEQGAVVGQAVTYASDLAPGDKWKFEAHTTVRSFHSYKVTSMEAFN